MTTEAIPFIDLCMTGRSVVFAPSTTVASALVAALKQSRIPVLEPIFTPLMTVNTWNFDAGFKQRGVLVLVAAWLPFGTLLRADRAIWFGEVPEQGTPMHAVYAQSMSRADRVNRMASRHHYDIEFPTRKKD